VGALTPSDVKRWDVNAIHAVFQTASGRAATLQRLGENLNQVHNVLADWQGEAGEAFRVDLGKARRDIEADGAESRQVATGVSRAEADVRACKAELDDIERAADANGWTITPDWRIDVGNTGIGRDPIGFAAEQQALQEDLNACKVHAHNADHELATAIRGAVGEVQLDATGSPPGDAPPRQGPPNPADPRGKPPSLQDMLLPTGAGADDPARMPRSLEDMLMPTGAGAGDPGYKPRSLKDLLLPSDRGQPSDQQPLTGSLPDLLSRLHQPVAPGAPPPQLKPADVQSFKAMLRPIMARDGVPPDQIEAQLDSAVAGAQKWLNDGMPNYVAPEPPRAPPPGFGEGFGDRWFATEQGIKDLIGQGGPGAPGVLESWQQMLKGTTEIAHNPIGAAVGEVRNAIDSPSLSYYLGGKASDGAFALPGLLFGGEGAGVEAGLGDVGPGVLETGPAVSPHAPIGFDHPVAYNPWADQAAFDLNYAQVHGGPTTALSQQLADMSTHFIGDNPDRVVLGRFQGEEGGYIGEARGQGGIYFDTSNPIWDAFRDGLSAPQANDLSWLVNEQFLRTQMENHVGRIDYILDHDEYSSLEDMAEDRATSFSAMEINFLNENAAAYGYERVGDSWVYVKGGQR
jgi:uncharacterized protein YukE